MDTPQEVQVWFILPALRRQFAICLKKEGLKQKRIAELLNLTEAAVSQYLKKKRGEEITFSSQLNSEITKSANAVAEGKSEVRLEIQKLLNKIRETRFICSVCNVHTNTSSGCKICYI